MELRVLTKTSQTKTHCTLPSHVRLIGMRIEQCVRKEVTMTSNQIAYWTLQETKRSNKQREREDKRSHRANEAISSGNLAEQIRSHKAEEQIDISKLSETARHNQAQEGISSTDLNIKAAAQQETERSNKQQELYQSLNLNEKKYADDIQKAYNDAMVKIKQQEVNAKDELTDSQYDYYEKQVEKMTEDINKMWAQYETDKTLGSLSLIEKLINDLIKLYPQVKGGMG
nr:putative ORF1 [Marmot picobirnavirus]